MLLQTKQLRKLVWVKTEKTLEYENSAGKDIEDAKPKENSKDDENQIDKECLNGGGKDLDGEKTGEIPDIKVKKDNNNNTAENKTIGRKAVNVILGKVNDAREGPKENERVLEGRDGEEKHYDSERKAEEMEHIIEDNKGGNNQHLSMDKGKGVDTPIVDRKLTLTNEDPESTTIESEIPKLPLTFSIIRTD